MSSSRSKVAKKDLKEYKRLSGKDAMGRLSWDSQALKKKLDQLRGSTTTTSITNITNNNYYSKSPQTEKKAKNLKKVENGRLGSTTKVKEGTHLCSRRSEKRGLKQALAFDKLYESMNEKEKEEFATYLQSDKLMFSFPKLKADLKEKIQSLKTITTKLRNTLQSNPELQKTVMTHFEETVQLLNDVPETEQEKVSTLLLRAIKKETEKIALLPLYHRQYVIVREYENANKSRSMETYERKIQAVTRRMKRLEEALEEEDDEEERQRIRKSWTKANQEKLQYQKERNETDTKKSITKKRKASDLWEKANPRRVKFHNETKNRGVNVEDSDGDDPDGGTYADAVKTTEKGFLAKMFGY